MANALNGARNVPASKAPIHFACYRIDCSATRICHGLFFRPWHLSRRRVCVLPEAAARMQRAGALVHSYPRLGGGKCMCSLAELKTVFRLSRRRHRPRMCSIGLGYSSKSRLTHLFVTVGALRTTAAALARALLAMPSSLALGPAQSTPAQRPPPCTAWSMSAATV